MWQEKNPKKRWPCGNAELQWTQSRNQKKQGHHHKGDQTARRPHIVLKLCSLIWGFGQLTLRDCSWHHFIASHIFSPVWVLWSNNFIEWQKWISEKKTKRKPDHRPMSRNLFWNQNRKQQSSFQHSDKVNWKYKGKLLTEEKAIPKSWMEYCMDMYDYKLKTDANILKNKYQRNRRSIGSPILKELETNKDAESMVNRQVSTTSEPRF